MAKRKIVLLDTQNFEHTDEFKETLVGESVTIDEPVMSIQEIMTRAEFYSQRGYYPDDVDHDDYDLEKEGRSDLADKLEYGRNHARMVEEFKTAQKAKEDAEKALQGVDS